MFVNFDFGTEGRDDLFDYSEDKKLCKLNLTTRRMGITFKNNS